MFFVVATKEPGFSEEQNYLERRVYKQTIGAFGGSLFYMGDISDAIAKYRGEIPLVFLTPFREDAVELKNFEHPKNCVYVLGSATEDLNKFIQDRDHKVRISTPNPTDMFGCGCLGIVLAHRYDH